MSQNEMCLIDADSIIYRIAFVEKSPSLCKRNLDNAIKDIMTETESDTAWTYIKGVGNFRNNWESYKAHRKDAIPPDVKGRILLMYDYAKEFAFECDNAEADDYVTLTAKQCRDQGKSYVIAHIDKDLNCIPGNHYNFRKKEFYKVSPEEGYRFMMRQILMGDSTDGIGGIKDVGPIKALNYTKDVPVEKLLGEVLSIWKDKVGSGWEAAFVECANLIYMRESVEDLRALELEELKERFTWKTTDTGSPSQNDLQTPSDSSTQCSDQPDGNT